tara:strand:- start:50 stop:448 length:399 start_codon:yes stop_codon:yes gene_type:complete
MIQRVQTLYLFFSILICVLTFYLFPLELEKKDFFGVDYPFIFQKYFFVLISIISFVSILFFSKRGLQIHLNRFSMLLICLFSISFVLFNKYNLDMNHYKILSSALINLILIILANKSISKDKKLIDSINRLR